MRERRRHPFWVAGCSARFKVRKGGLGSHIAGPVEPVKSCRAAIATVVVPVMWLRLWAMFFSQERPFVQHRSM